MSRSLAAKILAANTALLADGNLAAIAGFFTPDHVTHLTGKDMPAGHGAIRRYVVALRRAFAELRVEVEILVENGDRVAWQRTLRGTHRGAFRGFPASGRRIVWRDLVTSRFRGGRIAEEWGVSDLAEQLLRARQRARARRA